MYEISYRSEVRFLRYFGYFFKIRSCTDGKTYSTVNGPQVSNLLRSKGYQGELAADTVGDSLVNSSTNGTKFAIFFAGCDKKSVRDCTIMQFRATFQNDRSWSTADMNHCNSVHFGGRAWMGSDESVNIDLTIPASHVTDGYLDGAIDNWAIIVADFQTCLINQRK